MADDTIYNYIKDNSYFKCGVCGAETHVNDDGDDTFIRNWQQQQMHISRSFQPGTHVQGGSDPTGTSKKGAMKKKSLSQINSGLNGKCSSFNN